MTDAARAAVAAWMDGTCPHPSEFPHRWKNQCLDCLLAFAAAQRAEEREACLAEVAAYSRNQITHPVTLAAQAVLDAAVTWAEGYEQGQKGEVAARLTVLNAIRRYRETLA